MKKHILKDNILGVDYELQSWNAILLSEMLKQTLKQKYNISVLKEFSKESSVDNVSEDHPEIYEYQNFFLLRRVDGSFLLLDGFRRLLLYNNLPDINVNVRVYDEASISQEQLITLMLMLNHTKFFGGIGKYYDKGFNLLFSILFGFNINDFSEVFEGYVIFKDKKIERFSYGAISETQKNKIIKERLIQPKTIEDLQALYKLFLSKPCINMFNQFGTLLYEYRVKYPEMVFDVDTFIELTSSEDIKKLEKDCPNPKWGSREASHVKKLMEFYTKAFSKMLGEEVSETFVESQNRVKVLKVNLKKNKDLVLYSNKLKHDIKKKLDGFVFNKKNSFHLKVIIHPQLDSNNVKPDIYENFVINRMILSSHLLALRIKYEIISEDGTIKIDLDDKYGPSLRVNGSIEHNKVEVYFDITKKHNNVVEITDYRKNDD